MLVDLSVEPSRQSEFDHFYHDFYIPEFLRAVPEIRTARRYAPAENERATNHFLTIYELQSDDSIVDIETAIAKSAHRKASDQFKLWKQSGLAHFDRAFYKLLQSDSQGFVAECWNSLYLFTWWWNANANCSNEKAASLLAYYASNIPSLERLNTYLRLSPGRYKFLSASETLGNAPNGIAEYPPRTNLDLQQVGQKEWLDATMGDCELIMLKRIYSLTNGSYLGK